MRLVEDVPALDDAIAAARATADEAAAAEPGSATRARIRESLERPSRRRSFVLAAIAATLFGSTAFAYIAFHASVPSHAPVAPARVASAHAASAHVASMPVAPVPASTTPVPPPPAPSPSIADTAAAESAVPHHDAPPASVEHLARTPSHASHVVASRADVLAPDPELAAYRVAHELHFHGTDPAAALAAWDAYLAAYPNGQLVVDARYDRALALIKLKRYADARVALGPFAAAPPGSYHQADAARLLGALP